MRFQKAFEWIAGNDDLGEINRVYNMACFIGTLFCLLAGIESASASLSPILVANNFFYAFILGLLFYLSRFKQKFGISSFLSIFVLLFIYLPILWVYNGGSLSGIPYFIPIFSSFLSILVVGKKDTKNNKTLSVVILFLFTAVFSLLLLLEYYHPEYFYHYENETIRYVDIIVSVLFAITTNYLIFRAFIELYYKQLDTVKDYSQRLEELVIRDSMTGLYNHAHVFQKLTEEVQKSERYNRPFSIVMLDIDHFKHINDLHGHLKGDEVLIGFGKIIQQQCRVVDIAGRYGGEEFLIILLETREKDAVVVTNRLMEKLKDAQFGPDLMVTVSGGITQYVPGDTPTAMLGRADQLLYQAKDCGRNCFKIG